MVLVLKHVEAQINLDLHQFLRSDPIKNLEPEAKYKSLREHFSEHWGPHSSLDVTKIKHQLTEMQGDDPRWRKYLQNFKNLVGSLEQTMQRDANDAVIYWPPPRKRHTVARLGLSHIQVFMYSTQRNMYNGTLCIYR